MKKIAVLLAGCGVEDGSEIHESVVTLLNLKKHGLDYDCFSLDKSQHQVINHLKQEPVDNEERNMIVESARISRGEIKNLEDYDPDEYSALAIPGGFGVAKNLFTFAFDGVECNIEDTVKTAIIDTHKAGKPIGAICISPVLVARAFRDTNIQPKVTVGNRKELLDAVEQLGGIPVEKKVDQICFDEDNLIISCPAYTIANDIEEAASGIEKLVEKLVEII